MRARAVILTSALALFAARAAANPHVDPDGVHARLPAPARYLRTLAHNPEGYDPQRAAVATNLLLGNLLFHSPAVLGSKAAALGLSCNMCHPNGAAHTTLVLGNLSDKPGNVDLSTSYFRAGADDHRADFVNVPSLRGVRFTGPYGHDGRTASLSEFTSGVIESEFGGAPLSRAELAALVLYMQDFDFLPNANLDAHGRLTVRAGEAARRGEVLFEMPRPGFGGSSCATCHPASSYFRDGRVHRVGRTAPPSPDALEDGEETPTLLGTAETAPYFHDGRFASLGEVVAYFDIEFHLGMRPRDRDDLTAYLVAIGTVDRTEDDRTLAQRMTDTFRYLELCSSGPALDDSRVWIMALDLARQELTRQAPPAVAARVRADAWTLDAVLWRVVTGSPLASIREDVRGLTRELSRLAADWQGAL